MPPLPARLPRHRSFHSDDYHSARNDGTSRTIRDRRSQAARDRRFRPCRKGSAFLPVGPWANLARPVNSARRAQLDTQELPQPLSHHTLAHNFRHTPGWGSHLSNQTLRPSVAPSPARFATPHWPLPAILFTIRTFAKHARNLFGMRSFKTQDLKSFRMCSSEKTPEGCPSS